MLPPKRRVIRIMLFTTIVYVVVLFVVVVGLLLYSITGFRSLGPDN